MVLDLHNNCPGHDVRLVFARLSIGSSQRSDLRFWGDDSDRSNIALVLDLSSWINLGIRTGLRALALVGIPFLLIGSIRSWRLGGGGSPWGHRVAALHHCHDEIKHRA